MDSIKRIAAAASLMLLACVAVANDNLMGLSDSNSLDNVEPLSAKVFATSDFRFRGLSLDDSGSVGASGLWAADHDQPTIFHSGRWFASFSAVNIDSEIIPGKKSEYFGRASIGMFGQLSEDHNVMYTWSLNRTMLRGLGSTDIQAGVYGSPTDRTILGGNVGRTLSLLGKSVDFADVYGKYEVHPDLWFGVKHGAQSAGFFDGYSYNEVSLEKNWSEEVSTKLAYTDVDGGDNYSKDLTKDGIRLSVSYNF